MQKEEKQWKGPQEKSKTTLRSKTSKEDAQRKSSTSSLNPMQKKIKEPLKKEPTSQKLAEVKAEQFIYQSVPERRFSRDRAYEIIKRIVDERLETVEYSCACAVTAKELSDCIKAAVKKLMYDRYKLVCCVTIGQLKDSMVNCGSRAIWCPTSDTFTEYIYKNRSLFAVCILFAVYKE
ncbi:dynein light chain Tctex-type 5-A [Danio rerio]|uniref:Dynein light chain Tctex-type 5 n=1 Tax=Danio rerio TaxID=7955 RepID=A0A8M9PQ31_DANRE